MKNKIYLSLSIFFAIVFIIFTILVKTVDVQYIYNGTYLGFHDLNYNFGNWAVSFGKYDGMRLLSNIIFYAGIGYSGILMIAMLIALIRAKSLKKINIRFYILVGAYILIALIFAFFEIVKVNYSPDSSATHLKASYPSTHVFIGCSLYLLNTYTAMKLLNPEKKWFIELSYVSTSLICLLLVFTRLLALKHWLTDVIASVILVAFICSIFACLSHLLVQDNKLVEPVE